MFPWPHLWSTVLWTFSKPCNHLTYLLRKVSGLRTSFRWQNNNNTVPFSLRKAVAREFVINTWHPPQTENCVWSDRPDIEQVILDVCKWSIVISADFQRNFPNTNSSTIQFVEWILLVCILDLFDHPWVQTPDPLPIMSKNRIWAGSLLSTSHSEWWVPLHGLKLIKGRWCFSFEQRLTWRSCFCTKAANTARWLREIDSKRQLPRRNALWFCFM